MKVSTPVIRVAIGAVAAAALVPATAPAATTDVPDALMRYAVGHQLIAARPDDRGGIRGAGPTVPAAARMSAAASPALASRPDNRAGFRGEHASSARGSVGVRADDRGGIRGAGPRAATTTAVYATASPALASRPDNRAGFLGERPAPAVDRSSASGGFHWGDAGIGLGGAVGLMLLALAAAFVLRRERAAQHA